MLATLSHLSAKPLEFQSVMFTQRLSENDVSGQSCVEKFQTDESLSSIETKKVRGSIAFLGARSRRHEKEKNEHDGEHLSSARDLFGTTSVTIRLDCIDKDKDDDIE